ncbi:MAG: hypothetical protein GF334_05905 [Candidatus Altiarchaeales archaeon]|nr:hypothetical protein [Candidatus Altiarchaeales archaeon]
MIKKLFTVLLFVGLCNLASAQKIENIYLWIQEDGTVWVEEKIVIEEVSNGFYTYIPGNVDQITLFDAYGRINHNLTLNKDRTAVFFNLKHPLDPPEERVVWLKYGAQTLTAKKEGTWFFNFVSKATPQNTVVEINFPQNTRIIDIIPSSLLRTPAKNALILYPQKENFFFNLSYQYSSEPVTPSITLVSGGDNSSQETPIITLPTTGVYALVLVFLLFLVYLVYLRIRGVSAKPNDSYIYNIKQPFSGGVDLAENDYVHDSDQPRIKEGVLNMLDDQEKSIVRLILQSQEDEVTQAYIYKTTGIPKSTLSDKLKLLEKRKIISRVKEGRLNWIKLEKWVLT